VDELERRPQEPLDERVRLERRERAREPLRDRDRDPGVAGVASRSCSDWIMAGARSAPARRADADGT
jgi:hypothetical protein